MHSKILFTILLLCLSAGCISAAELPFDYTSAWKTIDSIDQRSYPKSAYGKVDSLYQQAAVEQNYDEQIKALIYLMALQTSMVDDSDQKVFDMVRENLRKASFPASAILHSIQAEMYWSFYQSHYYSQANRSETIHFNLDNIDTWDMKTMAKAAIQEFKASLEQENELMKIPVADYPALIDPGNGYGKMMRPTLYDLLAHRALARFDEGKNGFSVLFDNYQLTNLKLLAPAQEFIDWQITPVDTTSGKYQSLVLYQKLIRFHLQREGTTALTFVNLERLSFARRYMPVDGRDSAYELTLQKAINQYEGNPVCAHYLFYLASYMQNTSYVKALELCNKGFDTYPQSYGGLACQELAKVITSPDVNVIAENVVLPGKPIKLTFKVRNMDNIKVRLYRTKRNWDYKIDEYAREYGREDSVLIKILKIKPAYETTYSGHNEKDYKEHTFDVVLESQPLGRYLVVVSDELHQEAKNCKITMLTVSNLAVISSRNKTSVIKVCDRTTGVALSGVQLTAYHDKYRWRSTPDTTDISWIRSTDNYGQMKVPTPLDKYPRIDYIIVCKGADSLKISGNYNYSGEGKVYQKIIPIAMLFTDRSIYRPGQTIYCKGILFESDGGKYHKLLTNYKATVKFQDRNCQAIEAIAFTTNEYGAFECTFTAPEGVLTGEMTIFVPIHDGGGSTRVRVEEYKRPKFEVVLEKPIETYKLGQEVTVTGKVMAYAGYPIDGAKVFFMIKRAPRFAYRYWWWSYPVQSVANVLDTGNLVTDKHGNFSITFKAAGDDKYIKYEGMYFNFQIAASATDINGETHSGTLNLKIGPRDLIFDPVIDKFIPQSKNPPGIRLISTNIGGENIDIKGKVTISRLATPDHIQRVRNQAQIDPDDYDVMRRNQTIPEYAPDRNYLTREEFLRLFPNDIYGTENRIENWKVLDRVFSARFNTGESDTVQIGNTLQWDTGMYRLEAKVEYNGEEITCYRYFTVYQTKTQKMPYITAYMFIPIKTVCQPGEVAQILVGSSYKDVTLRFEVERQFKIVDSLIVNLSNEQKLFSVPVLDTDRGGFYLHVSYWIDNRFYTHSQLIDVNWKNKRLEFEYMTFRDKLLPGQDEEWQLKVKDAYGKPASADVLASMYDASLDALLKHKWTPSVYGGVGVSGGWKTLTATVLTKGGGNYRRYEASYPWIIYSTLRNFGKDIRWNYRYKGYGSNWNDDYFSEPSNVNNPLSDVLCGVDGMSLSDPVAPKELLGIIDDDFGYSKKLTPLPIPDMEDIPVRTNFEETAFFYPALRTDEKGEVSFAFTVPEALTKWKFQALALTTDFKIGATENYTLTQKPMMVIPNLPRFFREGDKITVTAKISSLDKKEQTGKCKLYLYDALSRISVDKVFKLSATPQEFSVKPGESAVVEWTLDIPFGISAVSCKVVAQSGKFSDGEENTIPILTNRMLVTESLPLPVRGNTTKSFVFKKLQHSKEYNTLINHKLTLEYTSNPAWYAVQALPCMLEDPYEGNDDLFTRIYANCLATHIANSNPRIKKVFEAWKNIPNSSALLSNLEKNQELKAVVLEETPWVLDAQFESQSKQRIGLLLDLNHMRLEFEKNLEELKPLQDYSGSWSWYPGMPDSWWITQYIVEGFGHLKKLGVKTTKEEDINYMITKALDFLDTKILADYNELKKHGDPDEDHLGYIEMHYLYTRSYYPNVKIKPEAQVAVDYYRGQAGKYWGSKGIYGQALLALAEFRYGNKVLPEKIIKSFDERAFHDDELGMWWKENTSSWYWYQAPIETQALLIEAYNDITKDIESLDELRIWLLKQKQTTNWKTTRATAEACYALLLNGTQWLDSDKQPEITIGGKTIDQTKLEGTSPEAGTGYFKTSWSGNDITPKQANVTVTNPNPGPAWGAMYWQYFEDLDKITPADTPLKLKKQLFLEHVTDTGTVIEPLADKAVLKVGDRVIVRIELKSDRDMEYVHMKDMRSAGFEPINVLSNYKYQDGLGYYEATGDAATNFFIEYLAKGTYVFEYPLRVNNKGDFSNGVTTIQCMYAPEFTAHSEGIRVEVK